MIEVRHLTKRYGDTLAVDDLNFTIEKGRIYGFLGPNGAGKSTTMNIITGYLASTDGSVTINGHDILEDAEAAKKNIGYLPELPPLYFDMTVKEYLAFAAELKKIPKAERKNQITRVCATTKLDAVQNRLIKNLSKGYRQRVGLAQALLGSPEILILDEPTVGLDPKQILEIRDLIKELGKEHTVILSSHILSEISAVCDYVLILSHGAERNSARHHSRERISLYGRLRRRTLCKSRDQNRSFFRYPGTAFLSAGRKESSDPCHAACETVTGRYLPRTDCR